MLHIHCFVNISQVVNGTVFIPAFLESENFGRDSHMPFLDSSKVLFV
jgi:hypothetical protein